MRRKTREKINEGSNCFHERWIEQCVGLRRSDVNKEDRRQEGGKKGEGRIRIEKERSEGGSMNSLFSPMYIYTCVCTCTCMHVI